MNHNRLRPLPAPITGELVGRAQAGDARACEELFEKSKPIVFAAMRRVLNLSPDAQDADDTLNEVWTRAITHLPALRGPAAFPRVLKLTAVSVCTDLLRRAGAKKRKPDQVENLVAESALESPTHAEEEAACEARLDADRILRTVGPDKYRLLLLRQELTPDEILERLQPLSREDYDRQLTLAECEVLLARARAEKQLSNYLTAIGFSKAVIAKLRHVRDDDDVEKLFLYASALSLLGDLHQARGIVHGRHGAFHLYEGARRGWLRLHDERNALYATHSTALCHSIAGEVSEALRCLDLVEDYRRDRPQERQGLANVYRNRAAVLLSVGHVAEAKTWIDKALPLFPDSSNTMYQSAVRVLGEVRLAQGRLAEAVDTIERSKAATPLRFSLDHSQIEIALCKAWFVAKKPVNALECADRARRIGTANGFGHQLKLLENILKRYAA